MATDRQSRPLLVLRAQSGDRAALDQVLAGVAEDLHRYLVRLTGREDVADDLLQEGLILICRKLKWLRDPRFFRAWSFRIVSRLAYRQLRRERRWPHTTLEAHGAIVDASTSEITRTQLETRSAARLIATLPPASRAALWLHYIEGLSIAEVADVLEVAPGTAKSRLSYGIRKLRDALTGDEPDPR